MCNAIREKTDCMFALVFYEGQFIHNCINDIRFLYLAFFLVVLGFVLCSVVFCSVLSCSLFILSYYVELLFLARFRCVYCVLLIVLFWFLSCILLRCVLFIEFYHIFSFLSFVV